MISRQYHRRRRPETAGRGSASPRGSRLTDTSPGRHRPPNFARLLGQRRQLLLGMLLGGWRYPGRDRLFPSVPDIDDPHSVSRLVHHVKEAIRLDDELPGWAARELADLAVDERKLRDAAQRSRKFTLEPRSLDGTAAV